MLWFSNDDIRTWLCCLLWLFAFFIFGAVNQDLRVVKQFKWSRKKTQFDLITPSDALLNLTCQAIKEVEQYFSSSTPQAATALTRCWQPTGFVLSVWKSAETFLL